MRTLTRKKQRELFLSKVVELLLHLGAQQEEERYTLQTRPGMLTLHPTANFGDGLGTVFTRFDDPQAARQLVDCNPYSGKWNFHYFDGWTVEAAIHDLAARLRMVLT